MNNNIYEERKKFNIVDALIIILLIIMVIVVIFRAQLIALFNDNGTTEEVKISFVCEAIPTEIMDSLSQNLPSQPTITWVESDVVLGKLTSTSEISNASILYYDDTGKLCVRETDEQKSFSGTISGNAINNNGCYIDGTDFLASGMTITLTNGKTQFTALITSVAFEK